MYFRDRHDAGRQLANALGPWREENPILLALPRGGVVVAYEVACRLDATLRILVARKLGAPANPEFGFGAIAPGPARYLDPSSVELLHLSDADIQDIEQAQRRELDRRRRLYDADHAPGELRDRTAIIIDDGLATGVTAQAAVRSARLDLPRRVILAVPIAPADAPDRFQGVVDHFVCPHLEHALSSIGQWYERFDQTTDDEVLALLQARREQIGQEQPP